MLNASEGLIAACGLVPSVFGRAQRIEGNGTKSMILTVFVWEIRNEIK